MTRQAYNEFLILNQELAQLQPVPPDAKDVWSFLWGFQKYTSSKYYHYHFSSLHPHRSVIWIWKSKCIPKIKFFAWRLLNDRLNSRNMLRKRNKFLEEGYNCALCQNSMEETIEHLFFDCPSAATRWFILGIVWEENVSIHEKIYIAKGDFQHPFFMEIFLIGAWCLWNERNNLIFNRKVPSLSSWKATFKKEVTDHFFRIKQNLHLSIRLWLDAL